MKDFFKALRVAWLAGHAAYHRQRWIQRRRNQYIDLPF